MGLKKILGIGIPSALIGNFSVNLIISFSHLSNLGEFGVRKDGLRESRINERLQ